MSPRPLAMCMAGDEAQKEGRRKLLEACRIDGNTVPLPLLVPEDIGDC